ncbi:eml4 [Symbiodinium pilosum]|uniref:Eml4 protein n=1 Tax=Symbiodinium pilosum TaxID=2952 RepID=A0A812PIW9_SYMPI|nr:eml4 [Symbiodinium pilosum]
MCRMLVLVSRTSSQSSETLPAQRVRLLSTSWADILDDDDEDPAPDLMLEAAAPAAPAAAAAPAGMEPAPESETALADCASLIKEYNVDPDLQGFQRSYALETAIADQHGESMQAPAGQASLKCVHGSRSCFSTLTYRTWGGEDVVDKTPDAPEEPQVAGQQQVVLPAQLPPVHHPVPKRAMHIRIVQATTARVNAACSAAVAAKQREALEVTTSSTCSSSSNSLPRGQEKGWTGKGQGKAARAALRQLIEEQKQEEADSTNKVQQ